MSDADQDYLNLEEIAAAMRMSTRWVRAELGKGQIEHSRPGGRIRMTRDQVEKFKAAYTVAATPQSITTGRRRKAS